MNAGRTDEDAMAATAREAGRSGGAARGRVAAVLVGTSLVLAYATLAVVQILVLNPLAAAPGRTLSQIHRDLEAADQSLSPVLALGIPALGVVLALVLGVFGMRSRTPVSTLALGYLVLLAAGTPAYFAASFGAGMSLADTYFIGGADHSPWSWPPSCHQCRCHGPGGPGRGWTAAAVDAARPASRRSHPGDPAPALTQSPPDQ